MSRLLTIPMMLVATSIGHAEDKLKPNTLTEKEIQEGWILLFDGETSFGWKTEGDANVKDGILTIGGKKGGSIETTSAFGFGKIAFEYTQHGEGRFEAAGYSNRFCGKDGLEWVGCRGSFPPAEMPKEASWFFNHPSFDGEVVFGRNFKVEKLGLKNVRIEAPEGSTVKIRNIKLRPLELDSLFDGKDLAGWKVFPGEKYKSKYSVSPEGWLNVKDGPGDLQTEKQYADFTLQLESISNGKMLNSGIFFRCLADQYQKGYEAQIQNGYLDKDRTKPVDYGTGAIYRRVKARKVVSNDKEWFAMTVIAQGKHFATWVNGYQTVDWIDDRKESENAREGCKTGKGHISIQGHDPTTDLSFRNIRIAEFPLKKDSK